jgi:hypothetical protein
MEAGAEQKIELLTHCNPTSLSATTGFDNGTKETQRLTELYIEQLA